MKNKLALDFIKCFDNGGKVIIFGNGGSMAEASHFAAEFIGIGKPAIALSDPATITALVNDYNPTSVFYLWIKTLARKEDLVIGISSSGKSKNVIKPLAWAKKQKINYIDFPHIGKTTAEVQNNQLKLIHKIYLVIKDHYSKT